MDTKEIQSIIKDYYELLHSNKFEKLVEMDKLLEIYNQPIANLDELENLKRPIKVRGLNQ